MSSCLIRWLGNTVLVGASLLALGGCGSTPPNDYFLLTAQDAAATGGGGPSLGIGPVEIPEYLKRSALVYLRAGNQLHISATKRWAEPLENGVARVLTLNLAGLLETQQIGSYPWHPNRAPDYGVSVSIKRLDTDGSRARLIAEWLVYKPDESAPIAQRISQFTLPLAATKSNAGALAAVYSDLLYQLSRTIAAAIAAGDAAASR